MGRYYSGDIEGKFWFAVQSSDDADFFGVSGYQPSMLQYYFEKENIPDIKKGIKECKKTLGENKEKLDKFFKGVNSYSDKQIAKKLKKTEVKVKELLVWYARLELGEKILKCVKDNGSCEFEAEC